MFLLINMLKGDISMKCPFCRGNMYLNNGMYICNECNRISRVPASNVCDVFICCTEINSQGNPTIDGMMANDIYNRLTSSAISAFYSPKSFLEISEETHRANTESAIENARIIVITGSNKYNFENILLSYGNKFKGKAILPVYSTMTRDEIPVNDDMFPPINYDNAGSLDNICNDIRGILKLLESKSAPLSERAKKEKKRKMAFITGLLLGLAIILGITAYFVTLEPRISDSRNYQTAQALTDEGRFVEAMTIYSELGNYKDSVDLIGRIYQKYNGFYSDSDKMIELDLNIVNGYAKIEINEYYGNKVITAKTSGKPKGSTIDFEYTDSSDISGKGAVELFDDSIKLSINSPASNTYCLSSGTVVFSMNHTYKPLKTAENNNLNYETESPLYESDPELSATSDQQSMYYVRTSAYNTSSQLGAFRILENAIRLANNNKNKGYKVFDQHGNLIYSPTPDTSSAQSTLYKVRTSAYDANSQLGAFRVLENAIKLANQNKSKGYKVYDEYGNLIYAP